MPEDPPILPIQYWVKERRGVNLFSVETIAEFTDLCNDGHVPASPEEVESFLAIQKIKKEYASPGEPVAPKNEEILPESGILYSIYSS